MSGRVADTLHKLKSRLPSGAGEDTLSPGGEKKKLAEVKEVLERLHRISVQPEESAAAAPGKAEPRDTGIAALSRRAAKIADNGKPTVLRLGSAVRKQHLMAGVAGAGLLIALGGAGLWWMSADQPVRDRALNLTLDKQTHHVPAALPSLPRVAKLSTEGDQIAEAEKLIETGKIVAARRILEDDLAAHSPDAALMLARSYDPNFLRTISGADAGPDVAQAERWYRTWHSNAAAKGLSMEPERLDRIIRAMR